MGLGGAGGGWGITGPLRRCRWCTTTTITIVAIRSHAASQCSLVLFRSTGYTDDARSSKFRCGERRHLRQFLSTGSSVLLISGVSLIDTWINAATSSDGLYSDAGATIATTQGAQFARGVASGIGVTSVASVTVGVSVDSAAVAAVVVTGNAIAVVTNLMHCICTNFCRIYCVNTRTITPALGRVESVSRQAFRMRRRHQKSGCQHN